MLDQIWNGILELLAQFVIPDWGAVIALLPVVMLVLVVLILANLFIRIWRAPKPRRGKGRLTPRTPAGIHLPGPSFSPPLAALGVFLLMVGLVFGGPWIFVGLVATVLTLLYWLAEAIRTYDRDLGATAPVLPAPAHTGPPPGVHMPGPSFRPFLGALGMGMLMLGLVFPGWLLAAGLIALIATLMGWLFDARREYVKVEEADLTGHLENPPPPRAPSALLWTLAVLLVGAVVLQAGWLPPRDVSGGEATGSGGPPPSGAPAGSGEPGPQADATVHAKAIAYLETTFSAPADKPFTLAFVNEDAGTPHNVELKDPSGKSVYKGAIFPGVATKVYDVPALPAGGYTFVCSVHPNMTGTATLE
jgi:plastocyanin